jgi:hypothetical protein
VNAVGSSEPTNEVEHVLKVMGSEHIKLRTGARYLRDAAVPKYAMGFSFTARGRCNLSARVKVFNYLVQQELVTRSLRLEPIHLK